jgi:hypothetical protein
MCPDYPDMMNEMDNELNALRSIKDSFDKCPINYVDWDMLHKQKMNLLTKIESDDDIANGLFNFLIDLGDWAEAQGLWKHPLAD